MSRVVITAGDKFTDIDAFGSAVAYAELLRLQSRRAEVVLPGVLNSSIPNLLTPDTEAYSKHYVLEPDDRFVVLDVSDPENIAKFVEFEKIELIMDHHAGFEDYWKALGVKYQIERVGAVCTQVFEHWQASDMLSSMRPGVARLLMAGILDNTLNFISEVTTERDRMAYESLMGISGLSSSWAGEYFAACQEAIVGDLADSLKADSKRMGLSGFEGMLLVGQIAIWDGEAIAGRFSELREVMPAKDRWFINVISISENKSYILCEDDQLRQFLEMLTGGDFTNNVMALNRAWLRKEILQVAIDKKVS